MRLAVNELFGPTFQGEGVSQGRLASFLRLHGCHLACAWCDTPQTWDHDRHPPAGERRLLDTTEVLDWVVEQPSELLVITGGEPLLQQRALGELLTAVIDRRAVSEVEVETSGTITPSLVVAQAVNRFTVSTKLANAKMPLHRRVRPAALRALAMTGKASWKFVVQSPGDLDEAAELVQTYRLGPVWVMPEGTDQVVLLERMRELADPVLARGWNLTSRLHTLLWGEVRGR
ncbi:MULTISPECIES: 7-carboxy-7-deazaguanine synthase QueE [Actinosynnema]|uniref:7-carboxy-7-deazaguanine synthase QueE n=1 Tax=Actinosynnema TaxID=40566 RepID=UPI0020A52AEB|nr:7-carboxy-7-deazaguanine synthase QueE [Actinosynnema pretiosum]MCP2098113.1 Organic radical activating enzyme [Actinosynnema pretiosum]